MQGNDYTFRMPSFPLVGRPYRAKFRSAMGVEGCIPAKPLLLAQGSVLCSGVRELMRELSLVAIRHD